jgi:cyclohexa-1,5-dienecarbonyl-CoA hydratase
MNITMLEEIVSVLEVVDMNPEVKILLLQGDDNAFSSGLDIAEHTEENAYQMMNAFSSIFRRMMGLDAVSVSVVKGMALGGGCELAVSCDFSFAAEDAKLGQPEIKAGLFPPVAAAVYPRLIGLRRTFEMLLTGRIYTAKEAERIGLITRAFDGKQLDEEVQRWIDFLKSFSSPVLKLTRQAISGSLTLPYDEALRYVEEIYLNELMAIEDVKEGLQALMERRPPVWKHR